MTKAAGGDPAAWWAAAPGPPAAVAVGGVGKIRRGHDVGGVGCAMESMEFARRRGESSDPSIDPLCIRWRPSTPKATGDASTALLWEFLCRTG